MNLSIYKIVFVLILSISGLLHASEHYTPRNCEFTAVFPDKPKVQDISVSGYYHQSATLIRSNYVLRASCSIFDSPTVFDVPDNEIIEWAKDWANRMGMIYPEVSIESSSIGKVATVKGTKVIQGDNYTYKGVFFHGKYSRMAVLVGGPASSYPTKEMIPFLRSVYRNGNSL